MSVPLPDPRARVGVTSLEVEDTLQGARIPLVLLYPTDADVRPTPLGHDTFDLAERASPAGERIPLVVVSHGYGGTGLAYRHLGVSLARAGFAVALLDHPGNWRGDNSLGGMEINLVNRPRHLRLVIDAAYAHATLGPALAHDGVAVVGHSMGGYTALAAAGATPSAQAMEAEGAAPRRIEVDNDPRVKALVLLAPAAFWFEAEGALAAVDVPILMLTAEHDTFTPDFCAATILRGVPRPDRVVHRVVPNAGHFAFLSPFPAALTRPDFPQSQDPPGFDRAAFQEGLASDVTAFLGLALTGVSPATR